jgi:hypothetical protein
MFICRNLLVLIKSLFLLLREIGTEQKSSRPQDITTDCVRIKTGISGRVRRIPIQVKNGRQSRRRIISWRHQQRKMEYLSEVSGINSFCQKCRVASVIRISNCVGESVPAAAAAYATTEQNRRRQVRNYLPESLAIARRNNYTRMWRERETPARKAVDYV